MAVIKKTLFPKNLSNYSVLVNDTAPNSRYFQISELPDTFTGGKNAFLIAGSEELVPDTKIQIELKDSTGNIIYHEPGEGYFSSSIFDSNSKPIVTEYYEGVSKVVAVYVYPDTAYGPCTLTILGELNQYVDENNIVRAVPAEWENKYNVKWEKQINVNPSLPNITKIRFYQRPNVTITEILSPIYRIESGSKVNSGVSQSFADIKLSKLETFAGDVKRVKVFRTSEGDISDFDLIQDILVESKELLTTTELSGSVIGQTGTFTSETLKNFWSTGSLTSELTSSRVESGVKLNGSGYFTYTSSLDIKSANTYELNLDVFYSSSTNSNLGIYLSQVTTSIVNGAPTPTIISSSIATLVGTQPTKNLLDTVIPFKLDRNYPTASLYFSQSQGEWHLGNISLRLSEDTAFSPDEISFITTMPTVIGNETFNFKFEFYDVNNNFVPVFVTGSQTFTGGNTGQLLRSLTFDSDRTAFRFSTGSFGNPAFQQVGFKVSKQNLTGSVTYGRSVFDTSGNYISPASYGGTYPGTLTNTSDAGATLTIANFSGSVASVLVGSIVYTASCDGIDQFETIYRFEDGDNAPGVFVTANTNQFIYKATDLSLNPTGQVIIIEAKRKNLASTSGSLTVHSGSQYGTASYLELISDNLTTGVATYSLIGANFNYTSGSATYSISGSDQFGNVFSDSIKISPVKILDGFSVSLTNDNATLPALSNGFVESGSFILTSGSVSVKVGNETIQHSNGLATNNRFDIISAITSSVQTGSLDYSTVDYFITRLDADSGSLNLTIRYKDGAGDTTDVSKLVTYTKAKKAAPILNFIIGNNNQSVTAKSTGAQIDAFLTASLSVLETYDGTTTSKTLTITKINTTNSYATGSTTSTTLALPNITDNNVNSVDISITGSVVDSETTTRNVFGNISLAKVKKAQPTITFLITPQAQTVTANSAGTLTGTIVDPVLSAFEGSSALTYNQGTLTNSQYKITSVTGVTVASQTPNTSTIDVTAIAADDNTGVVGISYVDSEGTSGTSTIKFLISKAKTGVDGSPGAAGATGPGLTYVGECSVLNNSFVWTNDSIARNVTSTTGTYYITKPAAHGVAKSVTGCPPNATYFEALQDFDSVATDIFLAQDATITRGLVMGTFGATDKGFIRSANASALMTGKGYYLDTTGSMRFGDPAGAHIKFTESEGVVIAGSVSISAASTIDGTAASTVKTGAASGATAQQNGSAKTAGSVGGWSINPNAIFRGTEGADDTYTTNNGDITFGAGWISAKQFKIASNGNASFKGNLTGASGTFSDTISIGSANNIFKADSNGIYLGNATFGSAPFRVTPAGVLTATGATISGTITITGGNAATTSSLDAGLAGKINTSGAAADVNANSTTISGGKITTNTLTANQISSLLFTGKEARFDSGSIGGWTIDVNNINKIGSTHTMTLDSANNVWRIVENSNNQLRLAITGSTSIPPIAISSTDTVTFTRTSTQTAIAQADNPNIPVNQINTVVLSPSSGRGDTCASQGYTGTGIVGLIYPTEEIWVDVSEMTPALFDSCVNVSSNDTVDDYIFGKYLLQLRVRKYANCTDAENDTNVIQTYTRTIADIREMYSYSANALLMSDNQISVSDTTVQVNSNNNYFRIDLVETSEAHVSPGAFQNQTTSAIITRFNGSIVVRFGRVDNGYSVFGPGGLQVYQGVKSYLNASATGDNFFEVKGKSAFLSGLYVSGTFSAQNKQFQITHPLDDKKWLYHTSLEAPRADLIYRGTLKLENGEGNVSIDSASNMTMGTFSALTKNSQLFLQNNESFDRIKGYVESGSVYVLSENENSTASIDWSVIAERNDSDLHTGPTYFKGNYKVERYKSEYADDIRLQLQSGSI